MLEFEPGERQRRERALQALVAVAHFDDEHSGRLQMLPGTGEDTPNHVAAGVACSQREIRLVPVLLRQATHLVVTDVWRIRYDEVVAPCAHGLENVTLQQPQAIADSVPRDVAARNFERRFQLADYVVVTDASLADGLLAISLKRELPEALKPRSVPIAHAAAQPAVSEQTAA